MLRCQLNEGRGPDAVDRAAALVDPPARSHFEIQVDVRAEQRPRFGVTRDPVSDRVPDHGDVLQAHRARLPCQRSEGEHGKDDHKAPLHHARSYR